MRLPIDGDAVCRFFDVQNSSMSRLATHSSAGSQPIRLLLVTPDTELNNMYGNLARTVKYEGSFDCYQVRLSWFSSNSNQSIKSWNAIRNYGPPQGNMGYKLVLMHHIGYIGVRNSSMSRLATHSSAGSQPIRLFLVAPDTELNNIYGYLASTVQF